MSTINQRIVSLRNELKLTQEDFAFKISVSRSILAQVETDRSNATVDMLVNISTVFNVSPEWLLLNVGEMFNSSASETDPYVSEEKNISSRSEIDDTHGELIREFNALVLAEFISRSRRNDIINQLGVNDKGKKALFISAIDRVCTPPNFYQAISADIKVSINDEPLYIRKLNYRPDNS